MTMSPLQCETRRVGRARRGRFGDVPHGPILWLSMIVLAGVGIPAVSAQNPHPAYPPVIADDGLLPGRVNVKPNGAPRADQLRVTLDVQDSTLADVLRALTKQAGLGIAFNSKEPLYGKRVSLHVRDANVMDAIKVALKGSGLVASLAPDGETVMIRLANSIKQGTTKSGSVMGMVIDSATRKGISGAVIAITGTGLSATTGVDGTFKIAEVPIGAKKLTIKLLGYQVRMVSVTVGDQTTSHLTIELVPTTTTLSEVVTTATGVQRRLEIGSTISTIKADSLTENTLINNVTDLLAARAPGVQVLRSGGSVGAPSRIRIRGTNSAVLNNDPIVIVDGVRMNAEASTGVNSRNQTKIPFAIGSQTYVRQSEGTVPSPLDYLDPNSIESIDILKGPSAASLYGSDAANGVILIKTKRGQAGPARMTVRADRGWSYLPGKFPMAYYGFGYNDQSPDQQLLSCQLLAVANGECTQDRIIAFSPMNDKLTTTQGFGHQTRLYGDASGGWPVFQYYVGGSIDRALGTTRLSELERRRITEQKGHVPEWQNRPNVMNGVNLSARTQIQPATGVTLQSSLQVLTNDSRNAQSGSGPELRLAQIIDSTNFRPGDEFALQTKTSRQRAIGSTGLTYLRGAWLSLRSTVGVDYELRIDKSQQEPGDCSSPNNCKDGFYGKFDSRATARSADLAAGVTIPLTKWLQSRTSLGWQYNRSRTFATRVASSGVVLGLGSSNGALTVLPPEESLDDAATAGIYAEQQWSIQDRLFLTAGIRRDVGSAFSGAPTYPKLGASWLLSRESFFPRVSWISNLRLRSAYGHSGKQPRLTDLLRLYQPVQTFAFGSLGSGLIPLYLGNTSLLPERGKEWEGGIDLALLDDRIQLEASAYRKVLQDALYGEVAPPSAGSTLNLSVSRSPIASQRFQNIGSVENRGLELSLNARVLTSQVFSWDMTIRASANRNRVLKVSNDSTQIGTPDQMIRVGYPLFSQWRRPLLGYGDLDHDGLISTREITLGDTAIYMGASYPNSERSYTNTFQLLNGQVRVSTMFQHTRGMMVLYQSYDTDRALVDPAAPLAQQALAVASKAMQLSQDQMSASSPGFRQIVDWIRFSEMSLQYVLPENLSRQLRSRITSVSLLGRNLGLWSRYHRGSSDPESVSNHIDREIREDNGTSIPQTREWTIRVNLAF